MNKTNWTIAVGVTLLAACASTKSSWGSRTNATGNRYQATCRASADTTEVVVQTGGFPVTDIELCLADGSVVRPRALFDKKGREIPLRWVADLPGEDGEPAEATIETVGQPSTLVAQFSAGPDLPGPRRLILTPESGDPETVLLATIAGEAMPAPFSTFGYAREVRTYPDGEQDVIYVREDSVSERHEVSAERFEESVRPSIERMFALLPRTSEEISDCDRLKEFLAEMFEEGIAYEGTAREISASNPGSAEHFEANPSRIVFYDDDGVEKKVEDPISTATLLVLSALNARNHREIERLYEGARRGEVTESDFVRTEALFKARNLRTTVELMQSVGPCLNIDSWKRQKYGHYYSLYSDWVGEAEKGTESDEAAVHKLAGILLASVSRRERTPAGKPLTYARRLEQAYRELVLETN